MEQRDLSSGCMVEMKRTHIYQGCVRESRFCCRRGLLSYLGVTDEYAALRRLAAPDSTGVM